MPKKLKTTSFEKGIKEFVKDGLMTKEEAEIMIATFADQPEGSFELPQDAPIPNQPKPKIN